MTFLQPWARGRVKRSQGGEARAQLLGQLVGPGGDGLRSWPPSCAWGMDMSSWWERGNPQEGQAALGCGRQGRTRCRKFWDVGEQEQRCCASTGAAGPPNTELWDRCGKGRSGLGRLFPASAQPKTNPKLRAVLVTYGPLATHLTSAFKASAGHLPCPLCNEGDEAGYF